MSDREWLARRALTWGASEIAPIVYHLHHDTFGTSFSADGFADDWRKWVKAEAEPPKRLGNLPHNHYPRCVYRKAGLMAKRKAGAAAKAGIRRELELLEKARPMLTEVFDLAYADTVPRSWFPLIDRRAPMLSATPDSWGVDMFGDHVAVEIKTTQQNHDAIPLEHVVQVHAQMAVMEATHAWLVVGHGYAADWREDGPITVHRIERNELLVDAIRDAATLAGEWLKELIETGENDESDFTSASTCAA